MISEEKKIILEKTFITRNDFQILTGLRRLESNRLYNLLLTALIEHCEKPVIFNSAYIPTIYVSDFLEPFGIPRINASGRPSLNDILKEGYKIEDLYKSIAKKNHDDPEDIEKARNIVAGVMERRTLETRSAKGALQ